jgi:hypothetical protein
MYTRLVLQRVSHAGYSLDVDLHDLSRLPKVNCQKTASKFKEFAGDLATRKVAQRIDCLDDTCRPSSDYTLRISFSIVLTVKKMRQCL